MLLSRVYCLVFLSPKVHAPEVEFSLALVPSTNFGCIAGFVGRSLQYVGAAVSLVAFPVFCGRQWFAISAPPRPRQLLLGSRLLCFSFLSNRQIRSIWVFQVPLRTSQLVWMVRNIAVRPMVSYVVDVLTVSCQLVFQCPWQTVPFFWRNANHAVPVSASIFCLSFSVSNHTWIVYKVMKVKK